MSTPIIITSFQYIKQLLEAPKSCVVEMLGRSSSAIPVNLEGFMRQFFRVYDGHAIAISISFFP